LQSRVRKAVRSAINESRREEAQEAGVGDRKKANGGQCAADHFLQPLCILLVAAGEDWTMMVNSIINNLRMEDVWLDQ